MSTDALKSLHTDLIDADAGYGEAIKDADEAAVKSLFETIRVAHEQAHHDVHEMLVAKGERPDEGGSFMSTVHKTVISVRSAVTGLNNSSLEAFASGEDRIVEAYDAAIAEAGNDISNADKLTRHKDKLVEMIATLRRQAAS